ncbi:MAG TPA: hypothetical protein DDY49_01815 [Paenibacillaceae bacterium]|nr:hypothetical protein [Paenibacillaceae bacterium]
MISLLRQPQLSRIKGIVRCGTITKHLVSILGPGEIAVINHENLDSIAASGLIEKRVKAVINCSPSFTGQFPTYGAKQLLDFGIPLFDYVGKDDLFDVINDGEKILIHEESIFIMHEDRHLEKVLIPVTEKEWFRKLKRTQFHFPFVYSDFIENTIEFIEKEKKSFISRLPDIPLKTIIGNRPVVVVIRGKQYKEDLESLLAYIQREHPVLIGVDGGADALLEHGLSPDLIIGDMDSVSSESLLRAKEIIVHAYVGGYAPGEQRVKQLGIPYHILPAPGVSEDVAMLLAYDKNARIIVGVGYHSCMVDFLEKGRKGMGSTLLVRMKIGDRFIDARGFNKLGLDVRENEYQHHYSGL